MSLPGEDQAAGAVEPERRQARGLVRKAALVLSVAAAACASEGRAPTSPPLALAASLVDGNGDPAAAVDGHLLPEGASPDSRTVTFPGITSGLLVDLGVPRRVSALLLQASADDVYFVEGTTDGSDWRVLWRVPPAGGGSGLRTRTTTLTPPLPARLLRIRTTTARAAAVGELQAFEGAAPAWPRLDLSHPHSRLPLWPSLTADRVGALRAAIAVLFLLAAGWRALPRPSAASRTEARARRGLLVAAAGLSLFAWPNFLNFHYYDVLHHWEFAHYYLGGKYLPELGYTRLYACAAGVDWEDGIDLRGRTMRDLRTNQRVPAEGERAAADECRARFSTERWLQFRDDARYFREAMGLEAWIGARNDHGFNGTPAWSVLGAALASVARPSHSPFVLLTSLDLLLIAAAFVMIAWAFGLEAACLAAAFWGTNTLAPFGWTGGGFLRYDWFFWLVAGVALLRRRREGLAGFALGCATMLRVFPGCALAGIAVKAGWEAVQERSLAPLRRRWRLACGALLAAALLAGASAWTTGQPNLWLEFAANSRKHLRTPQSNVVGIEPLLTFRQETRLGLLTDRLLVDRDAVWASQREAATRRAWPARSVAVAAYVLLLVLAVRGRTDWIASVLGLGLMPMLFTLSTYYYSAWVVFGTVAGLHPGVGFGLAALAWVTNVVAGLGLDVDEQYARLSLAAVFFVVAVTGALAWRRAASGRD